MIKAPSDILRGNEPKPRASRSGKNIVEVISERAVKQRPARRGRKKKRKARRKPK